MTREEEIKELESALRDVTNPFRDYDLETEAEIMIDDGWHKRVIARWTNDPLGIACSACRGLALEKTEWSRGCYMGCETIFSKYCPHCGAEMENAE